MTYLFQSLDQMLLQLIWFLDDTGMVKADCIPRSLIHKQPKADFEQWFNAPPLKRGQPVYAFGLLQPPSGVVANYYLRVYARQHATMQGIICQAATRRNTGPVAFRSALELLLLLQESLSQSPLIKPRKTQGGDPPCLECDQRHTVDGDARKKKVKNGL